MSDPETPEFLTQEWADAFAAALNGNPNYAKSAEKWEGDIVIEFTPDGHELEVPARFWADIWHGKVRAARFLEPGEQLAAKFSISSSEGAWRDLVNGKLDPNQALMTGKFKIGGDVGQLMRFTLAAAYILKYLRRLLKDW
ncbi:MAG: SCP2 sterol-binding domain-containing protein [Promethearchaeota archaeon]